QTGLPRCPLLVRLRCLPGAGGPRQTGGPARRRAARCHVVGGVAAASRTVHRCVRAVASGCEVPQCLSRAKHLSDVIVVTFTCHYCADRRGYPWKPQVTGERAAPKSRTARRGSGCRSVRFPGISAEVPAEPEIRTKPFGCV